MFANLIKSENKDDVIKQLLVFVLSILISTFILRLVWNSSLVKHITVLKPINSMLDAFILSISIRVIAGLDR
jgi:Zn-dependent protease with chaperone function